MTTSAPSTSAATKPRPPIRLWLYGLGMLVPTVYFVWRYPLPGNTNRLTDIGKMSDYAALEFWLFVGGLALLFAFYALALLESRRQDVDLAIRTVFGTSVVLGLLMVLMYPVNAIDIFIYAVRSRLFTEHGANPIDVTPDAFPNDSWMRFSGGWDDHVSPYGPLWNLIAAPFTLIAGDDIAIALYGFKILAFVAYLGCGWVIWRILSQSSRPVAVSGTLFFLWNPLVLWEGVGNGHNDLPMTLLLLLALLAWHQRRYRWVIPFLVTAALIKYVTVLLIPLAAVALWFRARDRHERLHLFGWSAALSLIVAALSLAPFFDVLAIWKSVRDQGDVVLSSPLSLAMRLPSLRQHYEIEEIRQWGKRIGEGLFFVAFAVTLLAVLARPSRFPRVSFEVLYAFLLFATWNFRGWYLIWPVGLAALFPLGWPVWRMYAWTAGSLTGYTVFIWMQEWWWQGDPASTLKAGVAMIFLPTLLVSLVELACFVRGRLSSTSSVSLSRSPSDA